MIGLPGSGKTTLNLKLSGDLSLPRFSLDEKYYLLIPNIQQSERDFAIEAQVETKIKDRVAALVRRLEQRNTLRDERYQYMSAEMLGDFYRIFEPPVADEARYMVKG